MIGRKRRDFKKKYSSYKKDNELKDLLKEGFVELLGVTDPKPVSELSYSNAQTWNPVLYEYIWSVGIEGEKPKWCEKLDKEDSIVVQLIFHTNNSRFYFREIAADLKHLPPFQTDKGVFSWLKALPPAVGTVGKDLETAGFTIPGKIASLVSTISETKLNTVSTEEFPWWTKTLCTKNEPGIEWHISRSYLQSVGGRFVGTLVGYFIDCNSRSNKELKNNLAIEIKAFLRGPAKHGVSDELWISPTNKKTSLVITPSNGSGTES